jgi:cobalamin biosynthesis protein CbiG
MAEELNRLPGTYSSSEFVQSVAGVDCVCERSAVRLALDMTARIPKILQLSQIPQEEVAEALGKHVRLLVKKQSLDGVTTAIAMIIS